MCAISSRERPYLGYTGKIVEHLRVIKFVNKRSDASEWRKLGVIKKEKYVHFVIANAHYLLRDCLI